ncbi:hypothetical protein VIGAN_06219700 [Vigna angularis var. angularis]|uniref:Uncharacterized protein n=1 Tax=Vigna angularis var. angularis TaxID=157739 RepID=A0A0S3SDQ9_PHAAN|nr:hypothetical protein VIGAN_06219700 [Vigna angularis var. angularis]
MLPYLVGNPNSKPSASTKFSADMSGTESSFSGAFMSCKTSSGSVSTTRCCCCCCPVLVCGNWIICWDWTFNTNWISF